MPYRLSTAHAPQSFCIQSRQTISAMLSSNDIAATHNITHSPFTSTCTTHPPLPTPLPSTTLLCTQLTNTKHSWQNVGMLWKCCLSNLVGLVFEGSIPTCTCFHSEKAFVACSLFLVNSVCRRLFIEWRILRNPHINRYLQCSCNHTPVASHGERTSRDRATVNKYWQCEFSCKDCRKSFGSYPHLSYFYFYQ